MKMNYHNDNMKYHSTSQGRSGLINEMDMTLLGREPVKTH